MEKGRWLVIVAGWHSTAMCGHTKIETLASAQMGLPHVLAARLTFGHVGLDAYEDECRRDPAIVNWLERIQLTVNDALSQDGEPNVTLSTIDGRQASLCVELALGAPANPISDEALIEKFSGLATRVITPAKARELASICMSLENVSSVRELPDLLSACA